MLPLLLIGYALFQPGTSGTVARLRTPAGIDCVITRQWNGWDNGGEPYTLRFDARAPGEGWKAHYLDHEASRWPTPRMSYDETTGRVAVRRGGQPVVSLNPRDGRPEAPPALLPADLR